jgi:hypothetical protein
MSVSSFVLGLINAAIVGVVLLLVGALVLWALTFLHISVPDMVQKLYVALVVLVVLYYVVAALFGLPMWGPLRG